MGKGGTWPEKAGRKRRGKRKTLDKESNAEEGGVEFICKSRSHQLFKKKTQGQIKKEC